MGVFFFLLENENIYGKHEPHCMKNKSVDNAQQITHFFFIFSDSKAGGREMGKGPSLYTRMKRVRDPMNQQQRRNSDGSDLIWKALKIPKNISRRDVCPQHPDPFCLLEPS